VTTGTKFANSNVPLNEWFYFIFHYQQNRSAKMMEETLGRSYKTALRMAHVTLELLNGQCDDIKLTGEGEFDEMYLSCGRKGEKQEQRPPRKRGLKLRGRGTMDQDKPPILGACDRQGHLRLKASTHANTTCIKAFFLTAIALLGDLTAVYTDEWTGYNFLKKIGVHHETVNHSKREYTRGHIHNNTMEGYWSACRHWMNTYRGVHKDNLPGYIALFEYIENHRQHGWDYIANKILFFRTLPNTILQRFTTTHKHITPIKSTV